MVNAELVDNVVSRSFALLKSVDEIALKVNVLQNLLNGNAFDLTSTVSQVNECSSSLTTLGSTPLALGEDLANMVGNIKNLHVPILKIPLAIRNLNEARKAIQYCIAYTKYLAVTAIPGFKQRIKPADQTATISN